jgi:HSP20 family protein
LLVVGAKLSAPSPTDVRFHLAERSYGRFARAVRVTGAIDASRARATVSGGELHIVLPRLDERRGRVFQIPVERA